VSKLRPRKPFLAAREDSVLWLSQALVEARLSAAEVINPTESVNGVITAHDVTRRVVAKHKNAATASVFAAMTTNRSVVSVSESVMDALCLMNTITGIYRS
jgi:predicted transcriptional regulator